MSRCVMCNACYASLMLQRSLGLLLMGLVLPGAAQPSSTCIFIPARLHHVDTALARSDAAAPSKPVVVAVDAFRRNGMTCTRQSCVANSCGDTGTVRIDLAPSADDATPPEELGYRLVLVRGELPESISNALGVTVAGGRPLFLRPGFDELPSLDVELAAIAVDAAGNESEPTEPFSVRFDGCTLAAVGDRCADEIDLDTDLSAVLGADEPSERVPSDTAGPVPAGASCSVGGSGTSATSAGLFAAALLGLGLVARRARRLWTSSG